MKTAEEIKRGLEHCRNDAPCLECEYADQRNRRYTCEDALLSDALAYIRQLEAAHRTEYCEAADYDCMELGKARKRIAELEAQIGEDMNVPRWISVEERLPDDLEEVLILVKETEFYGQYKELSKNYYCQYIGCVDDGEWFTVWCHGHRYLKDTAKEPHADKLEVTHWMPLPEPPKEG